MTSSSNLLDHSEVAFCLSFYTFPSLDLVSPLDIFFSYFHSVVFAPQLDLLSIVLNVSEEVLPRHLAFRLFWSSLPSQYHAYIGLVRTSTILDNPCISVTDSSFESRQAYLLATNYFDQLSIDSTSFNNLSNFSSNPTSFNHLTTSNQLEPIRLTKYPPSSLSLAIISTFLNRPYLLQPPSPPQSTPSSSRTISLSISCFPLLSFPSALFVRVSTNIHFHVLQFLQGSDCSSSTFARRLPVSFVDLG